MTTVATVSCRALTSSSTPPHWTKNEMVSTSLVTRDTSAPRRSVPCVSTDRSWTCRKARRRSVSSPRSLERKSRTLAYACAQVPASSPTSATRHIAATRAPLGPPGARMPPSIACCTATGTSTRDIAESTASAIETPTPESSSGDTWTPRRSV